MILLLLQAVVVYFAEKKCPHCIYDSLLTSHNNLVIRKAELLLLFVIVSIASKMLDVPFGPQSSLASIVVVSTDLRGALTPLATIYISEGGCSYFLYTLVKYSGLWLI